MPLTEKLAQKSPQVRERYILGQRLAAVAGWFAPSAHGFDAAHWIVVLLLAILALPYVLWLVSRDPVVYPPMPLPVEAHEVHPGQTLEYTFQRCNTAGRLVTLTVVRRLVSFSVNEAPVELTSENRVLSPGCEAVTNLVLIPSRTAPGTYRLEGMLLTQDRFRLHQQEWFTETFEVLVP